VVGDYVGVLNDRRRRMNGSRIKLVSLVLFGAACLFGAPIGFGSTTTAQRATTVKTTTITVLAGKPSELRFTLSKISLIAPGTVLFKVTNKGKIPHDFEICLTPAAKAANFCKKGLATRPLQPGKSQTIKVVLSKKGTYEFLCTLPGHASAGMKGLVGIGVKVAAPPTTTTPKGTTGPTTTNQGTTTVNTTTLVNDGCAPGMTIQSTGYTDGDDDETGRPTDEDGCV
jgi:uncharacterized cupredoxin-like copper-binding protein